MIAPAKPQARAGLIRRIWYGGGLVYVTGGALLMYGPAVIPAYGVVVLVLLLVISFALGLRAWRLAMIAVLVQLGAASLWLSGNTTAPPWMPDWLVAVLFIGSLLWPFGVGAAVIRRSGRPAADAAARGA